ncbi:MAG: hypothetical protein P8101_07080 [Candidatus Thiodiazotropha sp.]|jgi:hypothetical protein
MPPEKLLQKLANLLDTDKDEKIKCDRIADLLKKLKKREKAAKAKLAKIDDRTQYKRLALEIKILHTQRKKALQRFKALKNKCRA